MSGLLITPSILDSFKWLKECPPSWHDKAKTDLLNALKRVYSPMNPATQRGVAFEKAICSSFGNSREEFIAQFGEVSAPFYDKCKGALQQVTYRKNITVNGEDFLLYGKADIVHPDRIIDIKTTASWKGPYGYTSKNQHHVYIAASGITTFEYLVAVFEKDATSLRPMTVESVDASGSVESSLIHVTKSIVDFMEYLKSAPEFEDAYRHKFNRW